MSEEREALRRVREFLEMPGDLEMYARMMNDGLEVMKSSESPLRAATEATRARGFLCRARGAPNEPCDSYVVRKMEYSVRIFSRTEYSLQESFVLHGGVVSLHITN